MTGFNKTLVAAGVATAVLATGAAQAASVNSPSVVAAPAVATPAKSVVNETTRTLIDLSDIVITLGAGEALNVDDSVSFTLSSGTFANISSAMLTDDGASNSAYALVSGGVGQSTATFRVTDDSTAVAANVTLSGAQVTGTTIVDNASLTVSVDMSGFVGGVPTSLFGSPLGHFAAQLVPLYTATFTAAGPETFDVATGFSSILGKAPTPPATASTSNAGTVTVITNNAATAGTTTANGAGVPLGGPTPGNQLITLSGPMTGITSITATTLNGSTATGGAITPAINGGMSIDAANNLAYGVANTAGAGLPVTLAHAIQIVFAGTQAYEVSTYTATVGSTADTTGGYLANGSYASGATHSFIRNGSQFTTNSFGPLNKITITDRSGALGAGGADGAVTFTAWDKDGNAVACTDLGVVVPNNGTATVQGADVTAACPGAKRIDGIVNSTAILVSNVKNTEAGTTVQSGVNAGQSAVPQ